ncbi:C40 family peptidase [Spirillospora sp. CA-255316]
MDIAPQHGTKAFPPHHRGGKPRTRSKRPARLVPRTASCLLAATMLVTVPAEAPAQAAARVGEPKPASAQRLGFDAGTLRKIRAYNKYRRKITRQEKGARRAIRFARKQLGKPYGWGAAGPRSYDCSGLVMKAWRKGGVRLPRVSYSQYNAVRRKVGMNSLRPGDLVFFRGRAHVGMYVSDNRYIHAPNSRSRIRIDRLSSRKRQFAGAVRPGAPAPQQWPASIPRLARELEQAKAEGGPKVQAPPSSPAPGTDLPGHDVPTAPLPRPEEFTAGGFAPGISGPARATGSGNGPDREKEKE